MRSVRPRVQAIMIGFLLLAGCSKDNEVDASTTECGDDSLDCVPCEAGEHRCDDATLKVCQADGQGFDAVMVCVSEALCVKGLPAKACAAPVCNPADTKCEGATMWVCAPGQNELVATECFSIASCTAGLASAKCAAGECSIPADCTGVETECRKRTCEAGFCGFANEPADTPCETNRVCDGQGSCVGQCNLSTDCSGVDTACRKRTCESGVCGFSNEPASTPCETNRICDGQGNCVGQCNLPTDCAGVDTECRKRTCESGVCGFADSALGTVLSAQEQGDCSKLVCDGLGGTTSAADPADVPDDGNDCTIDGCDGGNVTSTWESVGTPCHVGGVCNGAGVCGLCVPSSKRCNGLTPQTCSAVGQWEDGAPCSNVCTAGDCTGSCQPGSEICNGTIPQTCSGSGQWVDGTPCPYVCTAGSCAGVCVPGTRQCKDARTKQRCAASGQWEDDGTCASTTPFCVDDGKCGCPGTAGPTMIGVPGSFCIDTTEVTIGQYKSWLDSGPTTSGQPSYCSWNTDFTPSSWSLMLQENWANPVRFVDWCDARAYCTAAGKRLCGRIGGGSTPINQHSQASVSQWYATCSSGGKYDYTYGDTFDANACWNDADFVPVGSVATCQSPDLAYQGVFDLSGNAFEWEDSCVQYAGAADNCLTRGSPLNQGTPSSWGVCASNTSLDRDSEGHVGIRCCSNP